MFPGRNTLLGLVTGGEWAELWGQESELVLEWQLELARESEKVLSWVLDLALKMAVNLARGSVESLGVMLDVEMEGATAKKVLEAASVVAWAQRRDSKSALNSDSM